MKDQRQLKDNKCTESEHQSKLRWKTFIQRHWVTKMYSHKMISKTDQIPIWEINKRDHNLTPQHTQKWARDYMTEDQIWATLLQNNLNRPLHNKGTHSWRNNNRKLLKLQKSNEEFLKRNLKESRADTNQSVVQEVACISLIQQHLMNN